MSDLPDGINLARHRDFEGKRAGQWLRHVYLVVLVAFVAAALLNVFGADEIVSEARAPAATLKVAAPERLRGGLLYQARFTIHASRAVKAPILVLDRGWVEEATLNAVEPEPQESGSDAEGIRFRYPPLQAGSTLVVYLSLQANPNNVGSRNQDVVLYDGENALATVERTQVNFP
jgi:hypothetical protein